MKSARTITSLTTLDIIITNSIKDQYKLKVPVQENVLTTIIEVNCGYPNKFIKLKKMSTTPTI